MRFGRYCVRSYTHFPCSLCMRDAWYSRAARRDIEQVLENAWKCITIEMFEFSGFYGRFCRAAKEQQPSKPQQNTGEAHWMGQEEGQ